MTRRTIDRSYAGMEPTLGIVGLDVGGTRFYTYADTLLGVGGYLGARLRGDFEAGAELARDETRRCPVYFVDRDPIAFGDVLQYLRTRDVVHLPPFGEDPVRWRRLRSEALFFALDKLGERLRVTRSFTPGAMCGRGVLHWIGRGRPVSEAASTSASYENPALSGRVYIETVRGDMTRCRYSTGRCAG